MTSIEMIEFIDEFLRDQEDVLHGIEGRDCTICRKYLDDIRKQLLMLLVIHEKDLDDKEQIVVGVADDFIIDEYLKKSVVNESFTTEKNERQLFEAFLNGYDAGYDAKGSNMINHNVGHGVRYIRRNFNEDFEL